MAQREEMVALLRRVPIFKGISDDDIAQVAAITSELECTGDEVLFQQGEEGADLYVVERGEVDIVISMSGLEPTAGETVATMRRGQAFGVVELIDEGGRSATAICRRSDTRLFVIPKRELLALCQARPEFGFQLMRNLASDLATIIRERTDRHLPGWLL